MKHTVKINVNEHGEMFDIEVTVTEGLTIYDAIEYTEKALEILLEHKSKHMEQKSRPHLRLVK